MSNSNTAQRLAMHCIFRQYWCYEGDTVVFKYTFTGLKEIFLPTIHLDR